jgi:trigger factor
MQTTIENVSALERRLTMAVPTAEIEKQVDERLKRIARTVKMAGFRPGKVPMKLVMQQYGPQVRSEVIGDAVERAFSDAVRGQNLRVAGYPKVEPRQGGDAANLEFTATFEIYPEVALGDLSATIIERPTMDVTDAEVDRTLEVLRKQRATFEAAENPAAIGDRVTIDFVGRIDGTEFPGGKGDDFAVVLGEGRMLPDFEAGVAGMKPGETRTVPVKFPDDYHGQDVAGKTAEFEIAVKKVEAPKLPAIDTEFAKTLGIPDGDLAKMRAEVRANVEREVKKRVGTDLKNRVMQALLDTTQPELPRALIDMEIQRLVQNARADLEARGMKMENLPIDPQLFEEQAKRRVALGLIVGEAVKRNDLAAKPEQVRALVEEQAQSYEQPTEVVKWFYSQPERLAEFEGIVVEDNVVRWVLQQAKVVDKPMAFEQLMGNAA